MRKFYLSTLVCLLNLITTAQNFEWAKKIGGSGDEDTYAFCTDANGNVYVLGVFNESIDVDPGPGTLTLVPEGYKDVFILKCNSSGTLIWAKHIKAYQNFSVNGSDIEIDSDFNILFSGSFSGIVDFDPGSGTSLLIALGYNDSFIAKLNANGNLVWAHKLGGTNSTNSSEYASSLTIDKNDNVYVTGLYNGTVDFDPGPGVYNLTTPSSNSKYRYVMSLKANGLFRWAFDLGETEPLYGKHIAYDNIGNIYITGYFKGTRDVDPGPGVYNLYTSVISDCFLLKIDTTGNFKWANSFGGSMSETVNSLTADHKGNAILGGIFSSNMAIGFNYYTGFGYYDLYIGKYDSLGTFVWSGRIGGPSTDVISDIAVDSLSNAYLIGHFSGTVDLNPGAGIDTLSALGTSVFCVKLDQHNNFKWAYSFGGGTSTTWPRSIVVDNYSNIYSSGTYNGSNVDFNPGTGFFTLPYHYTEEENIWFSKMSCPVSTGIDSVFACGSFTWLDGVTYTQSNSSATFIASSSGGCDSIITLNLQIEHVDTSITKISNTLTANQDSAIYQWLDCNNGYAIIAGETNRAFTPYTSGDYAVQIITNNCIDTSVCYHVGYFNLIENSNPSVLLYPNPVKDRLCIEVENVHGKIRVEVADLAGRILVSETILTDEQSLHYIDLSTLATGVYHVSTKQDNLVYIEKVFKL